MNNYNTSKHWHNLLQCLQSGKLAHAYSLCDGEFAKKFAELLLCENAEQKNIACGKCAACRLLKASNHPDLMQVHPEAAGKAIKIDQIRLLCDDLNKTSLRGGYKIAIIEPADAMNSAAANALLKTLEEPEGKTLIFLVSKKMRSLPATIRSRCQKISCNKNNSIDAKELEAQNKLLSELKQLRNKQLDAITLAKQYEKVDPKIFCKNLISAIIQTTKQSTIDSNNIPTANIFQFYNKLLIINKALDDNISLNKQLLIEDLLLEFTCL